MGSPFEHVYSKSPVWFQHVMTTVAGYRINRSRYGKTYWDHRNWLTSFDRLSLSEKTSYQRDALLAFVEYARANSNYYKRTLPERFSDGEVEAILSEIPPLEKETLRQNIDQIMTVDHKEAIEGHTGGTTGKSLVVRFTRADAMRRMAMLDHFKARAGFEHRKMRRASFTGKHIIPERSTTSSYWRYNHASRQMLYSSLHVSSLTAQRYVESLNRFKPAALDGFPSALVAIAQHILDNNLRLDFNPVAIFPTSETMTDEYRQVLKSAFNCEVLDQYASSEGAPFVTECRHGTLHVELSTGVFELESDGDILVTSFDTHGTPLIRYRIGDTMYAGPTKACACGIVGPTIREIAGRTADYLVRADGARLYGGNVANLFKNLPNVVRSAQLNQDRVGRVLALLVVDVAAYTGEHNDALQREFRAKFGPGTELTINIVDEIPRERSGKVRFIRNTISQASN